jgi:hypothetical protein
MEQAIHLKGENGIRLGLSSGMLEHGHPNRWSTVHFYHAHSGDRIGFRNTETYEFAVATYSLNRPEEYIYTYSYQPEENWAIYRRDLTPESYRSQDYVFAEECFFRVNVKKEDEQPLSQEDQELIENALIFFCMHSGGRDKTRFREGDRGDGKGGKCAAREKIPASYGFALHRKRHLGRYGVKHEKGCRTCKIGRSDPSW